MSRMSELMIDIEELLYRGHSVASIAEALNVPIEWVEQKQDELMEFLEAEKQYEFMSYEDAMDGDFDSAMASAGFGTDEDYGYYGEE